MYIIHIHTHIYVYVHTYVCPNGLVTLFLTPARLSTFLTWFARYVSEPAFEPGGMQVFAYTMHFTS